MELIMKNIGKSIYSLICLWFVFLSCDSSLKEPTTFSMTEKLIMKEWQFTHLVINDDTVWHVGHGFEPYTQIIGNGWVPFYWFEYNADKTYEFRSDLRRVTLGDDLNFQPDYGYWNIDEGQKVLIHNKGLSYEKTYKIIDLQDTLFIREYDRVIQQSNDTTIWPIGETVTYREILEKRKGPCCGDN